MSAPDFEKITRAAIARWKIDLSVDAVEWIARAVAADLRGAPVVPHPPGFAFDHAHGNVPIAMADDQVNARIDAAFAHPDSQLMMVVFTLHEELFLKIMGPPAQDTLDVLQQAADTYRQILRGH